MPLRYSRANLVCVILMILLGLSLLGAGLWLAAKGGSWFYALAGAAFLMTAYLLVRRSASALWTYALLTAGTLAWALWEVGLDWWPLVARGNVVFPLGVALLTPWVMRSLQHTSTAGRLNRWRGGGLALALALLGSAAVGGAALLRDPHRIEGQLPAASATLAAALEGVPDGEWHSYGRTGFGQRYSPLDQITPANVGGLQVAWTYHTGDERGRPGDPVETTFEVTPLKIGDRLFLCTPHQNVIALDADTGREVWRFDPKIEDHLALQHLTCRGLSYHDGDAALAGRLQAAPASPVSQP
ncbi:MAG: membrane-bound PQQ-dependent dehydrogenase, glucose/quinate/shikimate family, partial [Proteobacteria bacterium]